jgi:hypothetical protein
MIWNYFKNKCKNNSNSKSKIINKLTFMIFNNVSIAYLTKQFCNHSFDFVKILLLEDIFKRVIFKLEYVLESSGGGL